MIRFLRAGLVVSIYQIFAVAIVTVLAAFLISPSDPVRLANEPRVLSFLPWTYLIGAVGCALTVVSIKITEHFSHASNLVYLSSSRTVLVALVAQSVICVVVLAIFGAADASRLGSRRR